MLKKIVAGFSIAIMLFCVTGCYTHTHQVGNGPQGQGEEKVTQWYALYGLVSMSNGDTTALTEGVSDYQIKSQHTFLNYVVGMFTGIVTIYPKTVTISK